MLNINKLHIVSPKKRVSDDVHYFYRDSIKKIFDQNISETLTVEFTRNQRCMIEVLNKVIDKEKKYAYFFDIRLMEELGAPAPQYEIINELGLKTTIPLCIYGNGIEVVRRGMRMIEVVLQKEEMAVCAVSLLSSAGWQYSGPEFIAAFEITTNGVMDCMIEVRGVI